jgi:hypothetical protein
MYTVAAGITCSGASVKVDLVTLEDSYDASSLVDENYLDAATYEPACEDPAAGRIGSYGAGSHLGGMAAGCADSGWLLWSVDAKGIAGRAEVPSGKFADVLAWFASARPFGLAGTLFGTRGGPVKQLPFAKVWALASSVAYRTLRVDTERYVGRLVRLSGRVSFEMDGTTYLDTSGYSNTVGLDGSRMVEGDWVSVVGWVSGSMDYLTGSIPAVTVAAERLR